MVTMAYDAEKDKVLKSWKCNETGLVVSINQYGDGEPKVQIGPRILLKKGAEVNATAENGTTPLMMAARDGHIVATASMAGLLPGWVPSHVVYSAAKMGIIGMMMNLALEMKEYGVRTTTYCPGGVDTGMGSRNALYRPARFGGPREGPLLGHDAKTMQSDGFRSLLLRGIEWTKPDGTTSPETTK